MPTNISEKEPQGLTLQDERIYFDNAATTALYR